MPLVRPPIRTVLIAAILAPGPALADPPPPSDEGTENNAELPPLVKEPKLLHFVQAPYPPEAEAAGLEGTVLLLIDIDEEGKVTDVQVEKSAGHGFDEAAVAAARQFRFSPAEDAQGPVPVEIEFEYGFVLDASSKPNATPQTDTGASPDSAAAPPKPVNISGVLLEMGTRRPIAGAEVHLTLPQATESAGAAAPAGVETVATTDANGVFTFRGIPPGQVTVWCVIPGYDRASRTVEVVEGQRTDLKLWIRNRSYEDNEIVGVYRRKQDEVTRHTISVQEIRRIPGTFGDPVRVVQDLPGAARSPLGTGLLVIRGSNPEDSAVYIDGIRVPLVYHLGGYESVINSDLVGAVDYLPGGYGVKYGRSLGGVVDVRTRDDYPERGHLSWKTDILDSGGLYSGRLGRQGHTGIAVAARRSYIDVLMTPFMSDSGFVLRPRWYDYQLKLQRTSDGGDKLAFFAFGFEDTLFASTPSDFAQGPDQSTQGDINTRYSTHRIYLSWEHAFGERLSLRVVPSFGRDDTLASLSGSLNVDQWQWLWEVRTELPWKPTGALTVIPGVDFIGGWYAFTAELPFDLSLLGDFDPIAEREPWSVEGSGSGWGPDPYLDVKWRPLKDRDKLLINPGVRADVVRITDRSNPEPLVSGMSVDPRLAIRWQAVKNGTFKTGVGLYHEPPQPWQSWRPKGSTHLGFQQALSAEVGWVEQATQAIHADLSLFYKRLDNLVVVNPDFVGVDSAYFTNEGIGRVYGTEILLRHDLVSHFFGWVSYTLSKSERNDYPDRDGSWYDYDFDQTHILTALGGYHLPHDWEISGRLRYVTGNPYTPYSGAVYDVDLDAYVPYATGDYNSSRMPPFVAADLRLDKLFTFKRWQLNAFVDLLNVVHGVNPEYVIYNYDYTEHKYLRGLPFIPSPGFQANFNF